MSQLSILHHPDARLRKKALPVQTVDAGVQRIIRDMLETMYAAQGIGLAATQVNIQQQIIVIDVSETRDAPIVLINPKIIARNGNIEHEEGCLSVPDYYDKVTRPNEIRVQALDKEGQPFELDAHDLLAFCIQHEMDHLQGKLFVDYLSPLKQQRVRKKMDKWEKDHTKTDSKAATR